MSSYLIGHWWRWRQVAERIQLIIVCHGHVVEGGVQLRHDHIVRILCTVARRQLRRARSRCAVGTSKQLRCDVTASSSIDAWEWRHHIRNWRWRWQCIPTRRHTATTCWRICIRCCGRATTTAIRRWRRRRLWRSWLGAWRCARSIDRFRRHGALSTLSINAVWLMIHRAIVQLLLLLVMVLLLLQMQLLWRCRNAVGAIRGSILIKRTLSRSKRFIPSAIDLFRLVAS